MLSLSLEGRHVLVTGASKGIGRATAMAVASLGAKVTVASRSADVLEAMLPELITAGATSAHAVVMDFDDTRGLQEAMASVLQAGCLLYTSPSPRDVEESRMPSSA